MVVEGAGRRRAGQPEQGQLKAGAIGFVDAFVIGLAATSPAYSLAAVIGPIAALVGVYAPGVLLASFVPMALIATAFLYLNRVDQDCGTTFSWVTRAMGPWFGWIGGWAITMTGVLVIGSLADVGVSFTLLTFGLDDAADNAWIRMPLAIALILLLTWVCILGTDISARLQNLLILGQVASLLVFAAVAIIRAVGDDSPLAPVNPSLDWLNPFGAGGAALTSGCCSASSPTGAGSRRSTSARRPPTATARRAGGRLVDGRPRRHLRLGGDRGRRLRRHRVAVHRRAEEEEFVFADLADLVMGDWGWVVLLAVATSAIASTQTTIIPASRTGLSMARRHALPPRFGRIDPRHRTRTSAPGGSPASPSSGTSGSTRSAPTRSSTP